MGHIKTEVKIFEKTDCKNYCLLDFALCVLKELVKIWIYRAKYLTHLNICSQLLLHSIGIVNLFYKFDDGIITEPSGIWWRV